MGTYYNITYELSDDIEPSDIKGRIDELLIEINDEVSTYISSSSISKFNTEPDEFTLTDHKNHFATNLDISADMYEVTDGFFDPTVMPLVNYWGFGYTPKRAVTEVDSIAIDSMMVFVGFDKLNYRSERSKLSIESYEGQLDFSAIAKGYAVDKIGDYFNDLGATNYFIEIGGEVLVKGKNDKGKNWVIGINTPSPEAELTDLIEYLALSDRGLASSGNYRNYYEVGDKKYGHTINPKTGYPEMNELLAVSVVSNDCMSADAIATACMVMGYQKAENLIKTLPETEACFFIGSNGGSIKKIYSDGFIQYVAK